MQFSEKFLASVESEMKMNIKMCLRTMCLAVFFLSCATSASAQQTFPNTVNFAVAEAKQTYKRYECKDEETVVYFSNGVATNWGAAESAAIKLNGELNSYLTNRGLKSTFGDFVVANAFTATLGGWKNGFLNDVIHRATPDLHNLNRAQFYRWIQGVDLAPEWVSKLARQREAQINREALRESVSAGNHAVGYDQMLDLGRTNIVLGHSYGTILANTSYYGIEEENLPGHGIVMAALVDNKVSGSERFGGDAPYTTIEEDAVVFTADLVVNTLDANVDNWPGLLSTTGNGWGHGIESDYLNPYAPGPGNGQPNAREQILADIVKMKGNLNPRPCHGHLVSGGATTTDPKTGNPVDKQVAMNRSGSYVTHDYAGVPVLSDSGLPEKLIDWRGQFVQGEATRVLTFRGPAARYNGPTSYASEIYRWGKLAYRTPLPVLGAAIQKDAQGKEFVIAATHDTGPTSGNYTIGNTVVVWRRDAELIDFNSRPYNSDPTNLNFNPTGWKRVLTHELQDGIQTSPWFFNGSGTKAGSMRRQTVNRYYGSDRRKDPLCELNPGIGGYCNSGEFGDEFPAGSYDVSELRRYTLELPLPGTGSTGNVKFETHEWGDKAVLAVDYDDDVQLLLREENNSPRGFLQDPDPDGPVNFKWLTLNGKTVLDQNALNCTSASGICRKQRSYGQSRNIGGFFALLGDIDKDPSTRNAYHVFYSDLRTETFAYSIRDGAGAETQYWVVHDGKATFLGQELTGSQQVLSYISARYGYEGDYRNLGYEDTYRDYTTGMVMDAEKINPILGRYELMPASVIRIANPPVAIGFDVAADKSLLATGVLPGGTTFNIHSVLGSLDTYFPGTNLSGQTLLPLSVR